MNTTFRILWFEDEITWFNMEKIRVDSILDKHSLIPQITRKDGDDFSIEELMGNDYDLILMDFKLAEGVTGDTIVAAIRENDILTDVLFYSSEEESMLKVIRDKMPPVDGVYLTKRDYSKFTEKVEKLIGKVVRRSEDVVNLRGFVLDNTSDFELRIKEILNACWKRFDDLQRDTLTQAILNVLDNSIRWKTKKVEEAKKVSNVFEYANNEENLLSIADRLDIFQASLPILFLNYNLPSAICSSDFKRYYYDSVGTYRNKLGHVKCGDKTICIKGEEVEINQELHRKLRNNIKEVDLKIKEIEEYLVNNI